MGYAKNGHLRVAFCFSRYLEDRPVSRLKDPRPDAKVQFERTGIVDLTGYLTDFAEGGSILLDRDGSPLVRRCCRSGRQKNDYGKVLYRGQSELLALIPAR
jgi:hypothetical protein